MDTQSGRTLVGTLVMVLALLLLVVMAMRIVPVYLENYNIKQSIDSLKNLDQSFFSLDPMANVDVLKSKLMGQFDINGIEDIKKEQIIIEPTTPGSYKVSLHYTVIKSLVSNISLLFDFNESEEVSVGPK